VTMLYSTDNYPVRILIDNLTVHKTGEGESRNRPLLAGRDNAQQVTVVLAATCPAGRDLVALGDLFVDGDSGVRVGRAIGRNVFLETIGAAQRLGDGRVVADVVAVDEFVDDLQVPFPGFLQEAADDRLVLFRGHTSPFLGSGAPRGDAAPQGLGPKLLGRGLRDMKSESGRSR